MGLRSKLGGFAPINFWAKTMMTFRHVMVEDDSARRDEYYASKTSDSELSLKSYEFFKINDGFVSEHVGQPKVF